MKQLKNQKEANQLRDELLEKQNYKCPITGYALTTSNSVLDHDHKTGMVRGVLFNGANRALQDHQWVRFGLRKGDHPKMCRAMADYLELDQTNYKHYTHNPPEKILKKSSFLLLERAIVSDKGKLPAWWGYAVRKGKRRKTQKPMQKLSGRLQALYQKYSIEPEFYKT